MIARGKIAIIAVIGIVLTVSIVAFTMFFLSTNRDGDPNNEDMLWRLAKAAEQRDDPPAMALYYHKLVQLNPFNDYYLDRYYHSLVRMRDFDTLSVYTNARPIRTSFTREEWTIEVLLNRGWYLELSGSNEVAAAVFRDATNYNYYVACPELINCEMRCGRFSEALSLINDYIKKFPIPRLLTQGVEMCALANRPDLIPEYVETFPASGRASLVFAYYCDALVAWVEGEYLDMAKAMLATAGEVKTPISKLMALEISCHGDSPQDVRLAWRDFRDYADFLDFRIRGKLAVKKFVADHFPTKLPVSQLEAVVDEVLFDGEPDIELLRISLLAKLEGGTLQPYQLEAAEQRFPNDSGLKLIREGYSRANR